MLWLLLMCMIYTRPKTPTEARVVFELCHVLRNEGIQFDLEYVIKLKNGGKLFGEMSPGPTSIRLDVVILKDGKIVGVLEAKRSGNTHTRSIKAQSRAYRRVLGLVPLLVFKGFEEKEKALQFCRMVARN